MANNYDYDYDDYDYDYDCDWDIENDLNSHKTKDSIKWAVTAVMFLLVIALLIGLCLQVFGSGKQQPTEWFSESEEKQQAVKMSISSAPRNVASTIQLDNSYTLTATVTPATATYPEVNWSVAWKNPNSSWASGKSVDGYIGISANGMSATVTMQAAFSEQAIVTARSQSKPDVYATCTVDYVERLSIPHGGGYMDIKRAIQNGTTDQTFYFGSTMAIKVDTAYSSTSTVRGSMECEQLSVSLDSSIQEYIKSNVSGYDTKYTFRTVTLNFATGINTGVSFSSPVDFITFMGSPGDTSAQIVSAFVRACALGGKINFRTNFAYKYGGMTVQSGLAMGSFTVNTNGLSVAVSDVGLNNSSIAF